MNTLKIGDKLPNFSLKDQDGSIHNTSHYNGKKLIVFFYPRANTPGCSAQACNINDNYKILLKEGFNIIGVSADEVKNQKKFVDKFSFAFPLISDSKKELINYFGVWGPKKFMGKEYEGIIRTTFVLGEDKKIEKIINKVKTKDHAQQVMDLYK